MDREELINLKIDTPIYDDRNNKPVMVSSQFSPDKGEIKDEDKHWARDYNGNASSGIIVGEHEHYHFIHDDSPVEVRLTVLQNRLFKLEDFVYQRIR